MKTRILILLIAAMLSGCVTNAIKESRSNINRTTLSEQQQQRIELLTTEMNTANDLKDFAESKFLGYHSTVFSYSVLNKGSFGVTKTQSFDSLQIEMSASEKGSDSYYSIINRVDEFAKVLCAYRQNVTIVISMSAISAKINNFDAATAITEQKNGEKIIMRKIIDPALKNGMLRITLKTKKENELQNAI